MLLQLNSPVFNFVIDSFEFQHDQQGLLITTYPLMQTGATCLTPRHRSLKRIFQTVLNGRSSHKEEVLVDLPVNYLWHLRPLKGSYTSHIKDWDSSTPPQSAQRPFHWARSRAFHGRVKDNVVQRTNRAQRVAVNQWKGHRWYQSILTWRARQERLFSPDVKEPEWK